MGYRDKNGVVGKYRGHDVFVVSYVNLEPEWKYDRSTIYAVRCNNNKNLELVLEGKLIGEMTDGGNVNLFDGSRNYRWPQEKKPATKPQEPVVKQQNEVSELDLNALALNVEFGYGAYSKVVDDFFNGLDKLWAELEV